MQSAVRLAVVLAVVAAWGWGVTCAPAGAAGAVDARRDSVAAGSRAGAEDPAWLKEMKSPRLRELMRNSWPAPRHVFLDTQQRVMPAGGAWVETVRSLGQKGEYADQWLMFGPEVVMELPPRWPRAARHGFVPLWTGLRREILLACCPDYAILARIRYYLTDGLCRNEDIVFEVVCRRVPSMKELWVLRPARGFFFRLPGWQADEPNLGDIQVTMAPTASPQRVYFAYSTGKSLIPDPRATPAETPGTMGTRLLALDLRTGRVVASVTNPWNQLGKPERMAQFGESFGSFPYLREWGGMVLAEARLGTLVLRGSDLTPLWSSYDAHREAVGYCAATQPIGEHLVEVWRGVGGEEEAGPSDLARIYRLADGGVAGQHALSLDDEAGADGPAASAETLLYLRRKPSGVYVFCVAPEGVGARLRHVWGMKLSDERRGDWWVCEAWDRVFIGGCRNAMIAVDRATGAEVWRRELPPAGGPDCGVGLWAIGDVLYTTGPDHHIVAIDPTSGDGEAVRDLKYRRTPSGDVW